MIEGVAYRTINRIPVERVEDGVSRAVETGVQVVDVEVDAAVGRLGFDGVIFDKCR